MKVEKPDPPIVGKVTHCTIELSWLHVKEKLASDGESVAGYRYILQECEKNKKEWINVYS